jgi:excisionase family DNA binding protein
MPHDRSRTAVLDRLLTVEEAADRLGTSVRFVRRLVAERRIAYVKVGRHVRLWS